MRVVAFLLFAVAFLFAFASLHESVNAVELAVPRPESNACNGHACDACVNTCYHKGPLTPQRLAACFTQCDGQYGCTGWCGHSVSHSFGRGATLGQVCCQ